MKLKQFKEWINSLPDDFSNFDVVVSEEGKISTEKKISFRKDNPIMQSYVDKTTEEVCICIETSELVHLKDML